MNGGWGGISYEIALRCMPLDLTDNKSTLVQVMAWCRQATSHYLSQCWPISMSPLKFSFFPPGNSKSILMLSIKSCILTYISLLKKNEKKMEIFFWRYVTVSALLFTTNVTHILCDWAGRHAWIWCVNTQLNGVISCYSSGWIWN